MTRLQDRDTATRFLEEWFPSATALLGERVDAAIERFWREYHPDGGQHAVADAEGWMKCLHAELAGASDLPGYCADVVSFEGTRAVLGTSDAAARDATLATERNASLHERSETVDACVPVLGRNVRVERYAFDAPAIVTAIEDCDRLEGLEQPAPCTVLFLRSSVASRPRPMLISEGVAMLVALCVTVPLSFLLLSRGFRARN
jgi:hypothetical protein